MDIVKTLMENRNPENAIAMEAYLKNNFEFIGIKSPLRRELCREFIKEKSKEPYIDKELVEELWDSDYRELHYLAIDYLIKQKKKLQKEDIHLIKNIIITKSWWDTVDLIATHLVGELGKKYPELICEHFLKWSTDENMWLRRTAVLFQLKYKEQTDTEILEKVIKDNIEDKEFFIRKASGWALREYSKTNHVWVRAFVDNNPLSKLSKQEASKYL